MKKNYQMKFTWKGSKERVTTVTMSGDSVSHVKERIKSMYPDAKIIACLPIR